jgi:two-component sensor histidine kinase
MLMFKGDKVSCINQDSYGTYWIATLGHGLFSMAPDFQNTKHFVNAYPGNVVYVKQKKDSVLFATNLGGLFCIKQWGVNKLLDYSNYFSRLGFDNCGFYLDDNYNFYSIRNIFTEQIEGIFKKPVRVKKSYSALDPLSAVKAVVGGGDKLYVNARTNILEIDPAKSKNGGPLSYRYVSDSDHRERIFCMAKDAEGMPWYATVKEMFRIQDGKRLTQPQFGNDVFKFFDFYGEYLVGCTHHNQLVICRNVTGKIEIDSVPQQKCIWDDLYRLDSCHVLVNTNNLYRLISLPPSGKSGKYSIITIENPIVPLRVEAISSDNKNCYFFKDGSITSLPISDLLVKPAPPKVYYRSLKTGEKVYDITDELHIPFSESKNISISFATLALGGRDVFFQYSAERNNVEKWRDLHGEEIDLVSPGWGSYVIKIRAKSISSDYSTPMVFTLDVGRPFWATWWFIALVSLAAAAIVAMFVRLRFLRVFAKREKEHDTQVKFMKSEYKALNALMNPHFIFNTLNNVQGLVNRNDKLAANEYLRVFADLVRQNMHNISKEMITLQKEVELVNNYLRIEKLRFKELLNYSVEVDDDIDLGEIMVPPLLLQPLVENSIKHGILPLESALGIIRIRIYAENGILFIEVTDNGIGLSSTKKKQQRHESFGLENIERRIEQLSIILNKKIEFHLGEEKNAAGEHEWTKAVISMPMSDEHEMA